MRATLATMLLVLSLTACRSGHSGSAAGKERTFSATAEVLDKIARDEANGVPDAILNRTRCMVLVPAGSNDGIVSCLESLNRWTRPDPVVYEGRRSEDNDLLIMILGEGAAKSLRSGRLQIGDPKFTAAGPMVHSKATVSDFDLSFPTLTYLRKGDVLTGGVAAGTITAPAASRPAGVTSDIDQRLQRSLASFFNTITPSGIVIHHTAVLPTSRQVPASGKEVDVYHLQKGFDIVCFGREYHVAYHYLILENGKVQEGRPERCQGAHASGYNAYLGISVAGDFSSRDNPRGEKGAVSPTPEQQRALIDLCRRLMTRYKIPIHRVMRHSDVAATECPGDRFPFVQILQAVGR